PLAKLQVVGGDILISGDTAGFGSSYSNNHTNIFTGAIPGQSGSIRFFTNVLSSGLSSGIERVRIDSSGNVGIGTTTPGYRLTVKSSAADTYPLIVLDSSDNPRFLVRDDSGNGKVELRDANNNQDVVLSAAGNSYFNGGNVGIGTTNPGAKLQVEGGHIYKATTSGWDSTIDSIIRYARNSEIISKPDRYMGIDATITAGSADANKMLFKMYPGGSDGVPDYVMTMTGGSKVGIGTVAPNYKLQINTSDGASSYTQFTNADTGVTNADGAVVGIDSNEHLIIGNFEDKDIQFYTNGLSYSDMVINSAGSVGIGTSAPGEKLDVNGAIKVGTSTLGTEEGTMYYDSSAHKMVYRSDSGWVTLDGGGVTYNGTLWSEAGGNVYRSGGNVGIGTTAPAYPLEVNGNTRVNGALYLNGETYLVSSGTSYLNVINAANVIKGSAGTASLPEYTFTADPNTGIYNPAADSLAFSAGGIEQIRIATNGSVGIGMTNPAAWAKLDVVGYSHSSAYVSDSNYAFGDSSTYINGSDTSDYIRFATDNGERMRITASGNVGIGTTNPSEKLVLNGSVNSYAQSTDFGSGGVRTFMDMITATKLARIGTVAGGDILSGTQGEVGFYVQGTER
ncbi:MAG: hypothetical protein ABIH39_06905, partial [Candidatus Margulisiibacteriota bacterium]